MKAREYKSVGFKIVLGTGIQSIHSLLGTHTSTQQFLSFLLYMIKCVSETGLFGQSPYSHKPGEAFCFFSFLSSHKLLFVILFANSLD